MSQRDYHCSITANKTASEAFESICRVSEWWTKDLAGRSHDVNDTFTVRFGKTFATMKLIEVIPDKKIVWEVTDCHLHFLKDKKEWKDTKLVWEISSVKDSTEIKMTHVGLVPEIECYVNCEAGWNHYVQNSLLKLWAEGKGKPDSVNESNRKQDPCDRRPARAVADTEKGMVLATTDLVMTPDRVYRALTEAEEIERWWGSVDTYRMTEWKADFRVGGKYSVNVSRPDGHKFPASGQFLELDAPHKLVHTRKYEWEHPLLGKRETKISYLLDPIETGTRVTVRHEGFAGCIDAAYEHAEGWERVLGWLDHYLFYQYYFPKN